MEKFCLFILLSLVFKIGLVGQQVNPFELIHEQTEKNTIQLEENAIVDSVDTQNVNPVDVPSQELNPFILDSTVDIAEDTSSYISQTNNPFELQRLDPNRTSQKQVNSTDTTQADQEDSTSRITSPSISPQVPRNPIQDKKQSNIFVLWIALSSGLLLSILLTGNRKIITKIAKALRNGNYMNLFQKEENSGFSNSFGLLYISYVLNVAAFLTLFIRYYNIPLLRHSIWWAIVLVIAIILVRHVVLSLLNFMSNADKEVESYYFIILLVNSICGLFLIPINLLIAFGPSIFTEKTVILGIIILVISLILKWIRGFMNSLRVIMDDSFHFFLYLCSSEILPILLGIRILWDVM